MWAIWPQFLQICGPILSRIYFGPNIGMWGVQSIAMEPPAHTALFKSNGNHQAEEIGQNVNLRSYAPANYRVVHLAILNMTSIANEPAE